jgi:hypothetical protein
MFYDQKKQQKVQEALAWAYRQGYCYAEEAAREFADANGLRLEKRSLGQYGETLDFVDVEEREAGS